MGNGPQADPQRRISSMESRTTSPADVFEGMALNRHSKTSATSVAINTFLSGARSLFERDALGTSVYHDGKITGSGQYRERINTNACAIAVTATAVFKAKELGYLDLDVPITPYLRLSGYKGIDPDKFSEVTARHLLTHTSGLPGRDAFFPKDKTRKVPEDLAYTRERRNFSATEIGALYDFVAPVGSICDYGNAGIQLLDGVLLGALSQNGVKARHGWNTIIEFIQREVLTPLKMYGTSFEADMGTALLFTGMTSTAEDLAKLGLFIVEGGKALGGEQILRGVTIREMISTPAEIIGARRDQGHFWYKYFPGLVMVLENPASAATASFILPEDNIVLTRTESPRTIDLEDPMLKASEVKRVSQFWDDWADLYDALREAVPLKQSHPLSSALL